MTTHRPAPTLDAIRAAVAAELRHLLPRVSAAIRVVRVRLARMLDPATPEPARPIPPVVGPADLTPRNPTRPPACASCSRLFRLPFNTNRSGDVCTYCGRPAVGGSLATVALPDVARTPRQSYHYDPRFHPVSDPTRRMQGRS